MPGHGLEQILNPAYIGRTVKILIFKVLSVLIGIVSALFVAVLAMHIYVSATVKDPEFHWETQIGMWSPDPDIGYVNKPNFGSYAHGTIRIRTDPYGFRWNGHRLLPNKSDKKRIVYMGDSVMWGVGIADAANTIPGMVQQRLGDDYEVINAGVVGYSTLQEWRFLEKIVAPLDPDEVVINWCYNDFLPTEDPFGNIRKLHLDYFDTLLETESWQAHELAELDRLKACFADTSRKVWDQVHYSGDHAMKNLCLQLCVDIPLRSIARYCREHDIKLTFLVIPGEAWTRDQQFMLWYYQRVFEQEGIATVNMVDPLIEMTDSMNVSNTEATPDDAAAEGDTAIDGASNPEEPDSRSSAFFLCRDYFSFEKVLGYKSRQIHKIFFDPYHTTVRANRIIADRMAAVHCKNDGDKRH